MADATIKLIKKIQAQDGAYQIAASHYIDGTPLDDRYVKPTDISSAMVFKGTLGTGGTKTTLPTAAEGVEGDAYKVITAGTYANSESATIGDMYVCAKYAEGSGSASYRWVLIPSGDDEYKGTVTSISAGTGLITNQTENKAITTSGTISLRTATNSVLGGVKVGSNITNTNGTISLTKANVTGALETVTTATGKYLNDAGAWTTPPNDNTTYGLSGALQSDGTFKATLTASGTGTEATVPLMIKPTGTGAGKSGLVPAPPKGSESKLLRGDGTWGDHTHSFSYTPAGSITKNGDITGSFSGTQAGHKHTFSFSNATSGAPVQSSTSGDEKTEVLSSSVTAGSWSASVDGDGVLSFSHADPTFTAVNVASTIHKHKTSVAATDTSTTQITPAGNVTVTDSRTFAFSGTASNSITTGTQSA